MERPVYIEKRNFTSSPVHLLQTKTKILENLELCNVKKNILGGASPVITTRANNVLVLVNKLMKNKVEIKMENKKLTYADAGINIADTDALKREMAVSYANNGVESA